MADNQQNKSVPVDSGSKKEEKKPYLLKRKRPYLGKKKNVMTEVEYIKQKKRSKYPRKNKDKYDKEKRQAAKLKKTNYQTGNKLYNSNKQYMKKPYDKKTI